MNMIFFARVLWWMSGACLALGVSFAAAAPYSDLFQRYLIITNELPLTAYPVVQVPEDGNCVPKSTRVRRIIVNYSAAEPGLPSGKTARVRLPKTCWYNAGRLYIFSVELQEFEERLNATERTIPDAPPLPEQVCSEPADHNCFSGIAAASYPLDAPAQLVEYTFDAMNPLTGDTTADPNDPTGIPMTDIDISFVDELYLPVALTLDDGGASRYMGTVLPYETFNRRTQDYIENSKANWSSFAAYTPDNWPNNLFNDLGPKQTYHVPGGYNLFELVDSAALSALYTPASTAPAACSAWSPCAHLAGDCCPTAEGTFLSCCGVESFIIANTSVSSESGQVTNPSVDTITARWNLWLTGEPCADISSIKTWPSTEPQFDQQAFCDAFQNTVQYVWDTFEDTNEVKQDCAALTGDELTQCIIRHILGYTSNVLSGQLPESIQALQRNVPWGAAGDLQYQFDKWLLFWAPYDSLFNLNPYTRLIHNASEGVDAVAYSFSIDDKYGNYRERASGFIANLGGASSLVNKQAYDPYEQYFINWASGWDRATVCGRDVTIGGRPGNARVFFWQDGEKQPYCDVTLYTARDTFVTFRLVETSATVVDPYTGIGGHEVHGIGYADPTYCANNSSQSLVAQNVCNDATLAAVDQGDNAYVNLPADQRPTVNLDVPRAP